MSRCFWRSFNLALILTLAASSMATIPVSTLPLPLPASISDMATPMGTFITADTVWNSNQIVNQDVVIQNGAVLTITSGVSVTAACSDAIPYSGGYDNARIEIIVENGQLRAEGVSIRPQNSVPGCWYGIEFRPDTGGYIRQSVLTGGMVGIMAENSVPEVVSNTIQLMSGPNGTDGSSPSGAGNPGWSAAGIWISGTLASPSVVGNQIAQIQGGRGGAGAAGANATLPSQPGGEGGVGGAGGGAYGILVTNGAMPIISGNTIISLTGGTGAQGGNGGNGYSFTPGGGGGRSGGNGGRGGAGGIGGIAVGILINHAAPTVSENTIGVPGNELLGGAGQNGGAGGTGGMGEGGGIDAFGGAGPGGSGGDGGASGTGGSGGDAHGIYIQNDATPIIAHNSIANAKGGSGGTGSNGGVPGVGGMGCAGTTGGFWPGLGGNGGYAGTGGKGGDAGGGGQAVGITVIDSTPPKLARNTIHSISGGNAGAAGNGGAATTPGGTGGAGADVNPPGAGGAAGSGTNGGNGGNGGAGGNGIGLLIATVVSDVLTLPVVNNVIWDCQGGNASAHTGNGGNASQGGSGGRGGTYYSFPIMLVGPGGNGGQGGYGGNGGTGGNAGNGVGLWVTGQATPTLTNNTVAYGAFGTPGPGGTSGNGGQGGLGGSGNPVGPQGPPGIGGQNGQVGISGYAIGAFVNGQAHPSLFNDIFRGPVGGITNTVGIWASPPATTTHDYNDVYGYQLSFSPDGPSTHDITANPSFVDLTDFRLRQASPCVDTASDSAPALPSDDYDGRPRPLDGDHNGTARTDRGAYERGVAVATKRVSSNMVRTGDVLTYTLVVSGGLLAPLTTMPITLTDYAPTGTTYNGHLTYTAGLAAESPIGFNWHGSITTSFLITITFQVSVTASPGTITNTATYQDADGTWETNQVTTIIPYLSFLPIALRNY